MMQVIIEERIFDKDFLVSHTCAPFLVREDKGLYLRMSDLGVAPTEGPPDPTGPGQLYNLAKDPAETLNMYGSRPDLVADLASVLETERRGD